MPPQTPVQRPCVRAARDRLLDQPQHRRRQPVHLRREPGMTAIHRERVLREIVRADRKEVHLAWRTGRPSAPPTATSTMMPASMRRHAEPLPLLFEHRRAPPATRRASQSSGTSPRRCRRARAEDRAQLRAQQLGTIQQHADAALAEKRIVLARHRQVRQRLVAADVERPDDQPPLAPERARHVACRRPAAPPRSARVARCRNRNSERSRPTASAPSATPCSASASPPMFAATSTRWPSSVVAGSCACACSARRWRACSSWSWWMRAMSAVDGFRRSVPSGPVEDHRRAVRQLERRADRSRRRAESRAIARGSRRATRRRPSSCTAQAPARDSAMPCRTA